ncbi:MAG: cytochrome c biogenesis CcdA family protein [Dehalococcoidia bacterium]
MELAGVNVLVAFAAGLLSCISPCVLPLAPVYVGSLAGNTGRVGVENRRAPVLHALAFMAGFTVLFILLGISVGVVGYALRDQQPLLQKLGGVALIVMGLHVSRIIEIPALYRTVGLNWGTGGEPGYLRSFLAGTSISAGWLPCIGPTLGTILTLAVTSGAVLESGVLLLVYALGLAVPFVAIGITLSRTPPLLRFLQRHHNVISVVAGLLMIVMGVVVFSGAMARLNASFQFTTRGFGAKV